MITKFPAKKKNPTYLMTSRHERTYSPLINAKFYLKLFLIAIKITLIGALFLEDIWDYFMTYN